MQYVIKVLEFANGTSCPYAGQYLQWFDPYADIWGGATCASFTDSIEKAEKFASPWMAQQKWKHPSLDGRNHPRRRADAPTATGSEEGVERPLTAFTVEILPVPEPETSNMSTDISAEKDRMDHSIHRRHALTSAGQRLAETLWGIERFGRASADKPPPLHTDFAWQLQTDQHLRAALRAALEEVEADG